MSTLEDVQAALDYEEWTAIRSGTLPCVACGLAVRVGPSSEVEALQITIGMTHSRGESYPDLRTLAVTRCEVCAQIHSSAEGIVASVAKFRLSIGDPSIAVHRLELALYALDALGVNDHRVIDQHTKTELPLARLVAHMTVPGGLASWASHARRERRSLATPASASRWSHLGAGERRALNEARVALHIQTHERRAPVLAPSEDGKPSGCLLCGVAAVEALPSRAAYVWTATEADSELIGGRITPEPIEGVVCPTCDHAIDAAGAVGWRAMNVSIKDALGVPPGVYLYSLAGEDDDDPYRGARAIAWAVTGRKPNAEPWEHLDLSPVRAEMEKIGLERNGMFWGDAPSLIRVLGTARG